MLLFLPVVVREVPNLMAMETLALWSPNIDRCQHRPFGCWPWDLVMLCQWGRKDQVEFIRVSTALMAGTRWVFGVKLIGRTPLLVVADCRNRDEWRCIERQHADAVKSLSWRESMRKLLRLVEEKLDS